MNDLFRLILFFLSHVLAWLNVQDDRIKSNFIEFSWEIEHFHDLSECQCSIYNPEDQLNEH